MLAKFETGERAELETFIARAADAAEMFAADGIAKVMNTYNPDATASGQSTDSLPRRDAGGREIPAVCGESQSTSRRRRMNRKYELVYVVSPDATDEQVTDLHTQVEAIVQRMGGQIEKTENWGRRKLAYEIGRHKEGTYVLEVINGSGELMKEIDRRLKVTDLIIRHLVVRVDEEQAWSIGRAPRRTGPDVAAPPRGARPARRPAAGGRASAATPTTTATIASTWARRR